MEASQSQYCVRWRESSYVSCVTGALADMHSMGQLVDVTLISGGRTVVGHRLLLAACSPYFAALFRDNPCSHPVVIFRDVSYEDLAAVVHFIYRGEVSVPHRQLASFLAAAELLQVRGLTDSVLEEAEAKKRKMDVDEQCTIDEAPPTTAASTTSTPTTTTTEDLREDIADEPSPAEAVTTEAPPSDGVTRESALQDGELVKFRCQLCWKGFKHPTSLTLHKDSHTGKTQCPVCRRSFSRSYDMRSHLMKIHQDQPSPPPPPPHSTNATATIAPDTRQPPTQSSSSAGDT